MTTRPVSVCFVTNEIYPLAPGGIGRLMFNFARHNLDLGSPAELHYLVPEDLVASEGDRHRLEAAYSGFATIHVCPSRAAQPGLVNQLFAQAFHQHWPFEHQYAFSHWFLQGLLAAEAAAGRPFDVIEFPDFGGWATAAIEAKRARFHFQNTLIAARLHSTSGVIYRAERFSHYPSQWLGALVDAERHLLAHADLIVGHNRAIIDYNAEHYGLAEVWNGRTRLEFPPILADGAIDATAAAAQLDEEAPVRAGETDFIFSSRLQPFKRPDLFIRAATIFLERHEDWRGTFRLVSYGWDQAYIAGLRALVPPELADRIVFITDATPELREACIRRSVVVVPSDYESLCLFAFEAVELGAKIILNRSCAAFGRSERWSEGKNCLMFDGEASDLADVMEQALTWKPLDRVSLVADRPYWLDLPEAPEPPVVTKAQQLTLIAHGAESLDELAEQALALGMAETDGAEVIFLLPRALFRDPAAAAAIVTGRGWQVAWQSGLGEDAATLTKRLRECASDFLAFVPAGFELHPRYLECARSVFAADDSLDIVAGHLRIVDATTGHSDAVRAFAGAMPSLALVSTRVAPPVAVFRRQLLQRLGFDPRAGTCWFEVWLRDMVMSGANVLIMPSIAADLISNRDRRDNSKNITAGVMDEHGLALGSPARLLTVNPADPPDWQADLPVVIAGDAFHHARQIEPCNSPRSWPLVAVHPELGGLLVHPTEEGMTIAEIEGPPHRLKRLQARVKNASRENSGIEAAIALISRDMDDQTIRRMVAGEMESWRAPLCDWHRIDPGEEAALSLSVQGASFGRDRIIMLSRVPRNGEETYCHLVFLSIDAFLYSSLS